MNNNEDDENVSFGNEAVLGTLQKEEEGEASGEKSKDVDANETIVEGRKRAKWKKFFFFFFFFFFNI
jgi:hypothetical protein